MKPTFVIGLLAFSVANMSWAIGPGPFSPNQQDTADWLHLQSSGKAASTTPQPASPLERDLSLQRWLNSYQHPIPDFYDQKKGGSTSSGGGGGGS